MTTIIKPGIERILKIFYRIDKIHLRAISRETNMYGQSVTRYLNELEKEKILKSKKEGNLKIYSWDKNNKVYSIKTLFDLERLEKLPFQKKRLRDDDGKIYTQFILKRGWWPWGFTTLGRVEYEGGLSKYLSKEIQKRNQKRIVTFAGRWWGASRNLVERGLWIVPGEQMEPLEGRGRGDLSRVWFGDLRDFKTLEGFKHICQNNPECSKEYAEKMKAIRHSRGESFQELRNRIMGVK